MYPTAVWDHGIFKSPEKIKGAIGICKRRYLDRAGALVLLHGQIGIGATREPYRKESCEMEALIHRIIDDLKPVVVKVEVPIVRGIKNLLKGQDFVAID